MRLLKNIFLLCLFLSIASSANASAAAERHQSLTKFSSFEITAKNLKQYKPNIAITIQLNHLIYRATLAEALVFQLLSLAFAVSLLYLYTN